jgi:ribonuclease HI
MQQVVIYTDGACEGNPGRGGYGVVILSAGQREELSGGFRLTTNNRMEIYAAIKGLEALKEPSRVTLYSDSEYLVKAMTQKWVQRWKANHWKRNKRERALNEDLWERLLSVCEGHQVEFAWVKGHAGLRENERCDRLSMEALKQKNLSIDEGYESSQSQKQIPLDI